MWRGDANETEGQAARQPVICPLCERPIPSGSKSSLHHLTPKLKGGARHGTVRLHQICHSAIHARFSEAEIARRLADVEARYEADLDRVLRRAKTSRVRDRAVRILAERHRKDREPRVLRLAELHQRMTAMRMFRHRSVQ